MAIYHLRFIADVTLSVSSEDPNMSAFAIKLAEREDVQSILRARAKFEPTSWMAGSGAVAEFRLQLEPSLVKVATLL